MSQIAIQQWKSRPVFISSTFRDMQAERDHLRNIVLPRLEEELHKRRYHLEWIEPTIITDSICEFAFLLSLSVLQPNDNHPQLSTWARMNKALADAGLSEDYIQRYVRTYLPAD